MKGSVNYLGLVDAFHRAFQYKQPTPEVPSLNDTKTNDLREDLLREELNELEAALSKRDAVGALDALCDMQYVLSGAVLALGFGRVFDAAFVNVHASNMSKAWTLAEVMKWRQAHPPGTTELSFVEGPNGWIARRADGKIIKAPSYTPANLKQFVE